MKITQISVNGLFGIFDHLIPLNTDERITIIHGLNGFGKTNILRILNGIFNCQYSILLDIPFDNFKVYFDNNGIFEITKQSNDPEEQNNETNIIFNYHQSDFEPISFTPRIEINNFSPRMISDTNIFRNISINNLRASIISGENIITQNSEDSNIESFPKSLRLSEEPDKFKQLKKSISLRLIESQRLLNKNDSDSSSMLPTVSTYSDEIAELMRDKFAEYGKVSQSLDRSFPIRAVQQQHSTDLNDEQLKEQLNELENTRARLTELGLLDQDENPDFPTQLQDIDESTRNILSVYVEDTKKKLSIFNETASKIELLRTIINRKFAYSYKEMNFSKEKGFVFTTRYPNSSESDSKTLSPTDLSSGEQHELVLLYELLFKVEANSLVLIDEPELSLHVVWQSQFLKDLQEITELADLDILLATHSPDIIQDRWDDLTVELKAPGK